MYNINNLMAIEVDKQIIKFESLIVYNNFISLRNEITFKDIEKEISKLILKEFDKYYDNNNIQNLNDFNILNNLIDKFLPHIISNKKINKKLIADKFFIYDYITARQEQIKQMNNQIIEEYEDKIQNIKNDSEDNKTSRINYLKKELSQDKINTTDTQILEELKKIENIPYGTARRYYDDIKPFIDNCKYKELITRTIN